MIADMLIPELIRPCFYKTADNFYKKQFKNIIEVL